MITDERQQQLKLLICGRENLHNSFPRSSFHFQHNQTVLASLACVACSGGKQWPAGSVVQSELMMQRDEISHRLKRSELTGESLVLSLRLRMQRRANRRRDETNVPPSSSSSSEPVSEWAALLAGLFSDLSLMDSSSTRASEDAATSAHDTHTGGNNQDERGTSDAAEAREVCACVRERETERQIVSDVCCDPV